MLFVFAAFSMGMAQSISSITLEGNGVYNRFLASDLGFTAGGKDNKVFRVVFDGASSTSNYHLYIH